MSQAEVEVEQVGLARTEEELDTVFIQEAEGFHHHAHHQRGAAQVGAHHGAFTDGQRIDGQFIHEALQGVVGNLALGDGIAPVHPGRGDRFPVELDVEQMGVVVFRFDEQAVVVVGDGMIPAHLLDVHIVAQPEHGFFFFIGFGNTKHGLRYISRQMDSPSLQWGKS